MKWLKYSLPLLSVFVIGLVALVYLKGFSISAQTTDTHDFQTIVTVGNSAPVFTVAPAESLASYATAPTAIGGVITFSATATDANNENYYLVLCSTNSVTAGTGGAAPTCGGTRYCVSSSTASGSSSSCTYTTKAADPWQNAWYAFVCDNNATSATCSSAHQGSGNSGSPFFVNHPPVFTVINNNSPQNPGQNVTWTTTASDPDASSTVKLLVCKTNAMSAGACTGGAWCTSSAVASNPTCSYSIPIPTADGSNNAWVYVVDQFNTPASGSGTKQGSASNFVVNNVAPVVSAVTLNGGAAINLVESSTKATSITATVTDNNGCSGGEITSVNAYVYRSGITYTGCDTAGEADGNNCYPEISCTVGTCTGATATYSCTANLQYYADPTDLNYWDMDGEGGPLFYHPMFRHENWLATVKATDNNSLSGNTQSAGVEVNGLAAFSIPTSLSYGNLSAGNKNDPLDNTLVVTPTGNAPFHVMLSGTNMCTDYSTCSSSGGRTPIGVAKQKYGLAASTSYASGTALSVTPTKALLNVQKITNPLSIPTKTIWWGIEIPLGTIAGTYSGVNTITSTAEGTMPSGPYQ